MSGKPDYDVGDVVVCVDASWDGAHNTSAGKLALGRMYRVERIFASRVCIVCAALVGVRSDDIEGGFRADRFRKVRPASDEFTRQMRALRPIKAREDA